MKAALTALLVIATVTVAPAAKPTPSIEELQSEFEKRVLAEVKVDGESRPQEIVKAAAEVARDVFGKHPEVLRAKAKELLKKLPSLKPDVLTGYVARHALTNIPQLLAEEKMDETAFFAFGWQPARVAAVAKNLVLARHITPQQLGRRSVLAHFVLDKVYTVPGRETTTLAVKSLGDYVLVEMRLEKSGVFVPVSVSWMVEKTPEPQDQPDK
jgi:hypothetical protein